MQTKKLYQIFEHQLFSFHNPDEDRHGFIMSVVKEYLSYMQGLGLSVPNEWRQAVCEELFSQVNQMLIKKIYGCQTIDQYLKQDKKEKEQEKSWSILRRKPARRTTQRSHRNKKAA